MCCCRDLVLAAEAGDGGTRSRTLTIDVSGGGCSEMESIVRALKGTYS